MMVGASYTVNVIPGVFRPALVALIPNIDGSTSVMLDVGINPDCKPDVMLQYAILGTVYAKYVLGIENPPDILPEYFILSQNFPNPFNPITTIKYSVPTTSNISLVIYDILGREIKTLVNEEKLPGNYNVQFDGSDLSSGVYFYVMKADNFIDTKKLILLK